MNNKSLELNEQLRALVLDGMKKNLINVLESTEHKMISLCKETADSVWGYRYVGEELVEMRVLGVALGDNGEILVYMENYGIEYSLEDLLDSDKIDEDNWFSLFGGELLSWFTLMNINEVLHEYI